MRTTISMFLMGSVLALGACSDDADTDAADQPTDAAAAVAEAPTPEPAYAERLSDVERQFVNAMRNGNIQDATFYLNEGVVDAKNLSTGRSLVSYLYGSGDCDVDSGDCTPGQDVLQALIGAEYNLDEQLSDGRRPISFVCWGNSIGQNNARMLTALGVDVNFTDAQGVSPLHYCARRRTTDTSEGQIEYKDAVTKTIGYLLAGGADIDIRDTRSRPATHSSFREPFYQGSTPLMQAVDYVGEISMRRFGTVEYLLANGADASLIDANGFGVANYLQYPSRDRHFEPTLELLGMLHKAGADVLHKTPEGKSLETMALDRGDIDFVRNLRALASSPRS